MILRHVLAGVALGTLWMSTAALADNGPFTQQQADDGHTKFNNHCAQCHKPDLTGALGPSLVDDKFKAKFAGKPVTELRDFVYENMPQTAPKSLPDEQLNPIVAWILSKNGVKPGDKPLSKETASAQFPK
jgi:S-disulfanyl-L-cysteine oxidoreductase SoxD